MVNRHPGESLRAEWPATILVADDEPIARQLEAFDRLDADDGQQWDRDVVDAFLALYSGNSRTADILEGL
jgi:hypothetical protein